MRMNVTRDDTVRTISVDITDGPDLEAGWATWRSKPRPFQFQHLQITVQAGALQWAVVSGHLRLKAGNLSGSLTDSVRMHSKDLESAPPWLQTLVLDTISNVKAANYPTPEAHILMGHS